MFRQILHLHLAQHIGHVLLLHRLRPKPLQLIPTTAQQFLALVQIGLDVIDLAARSGNLGGHLAKEIHHLGQVAVVLCHQFIEPDVGLLCLTFDFLLFLLALFECFAGVQGFDHRN